MCIKEHCLNFEETNMHYHHPFLWTKNGFASNMLGQYATTWSPCIWVDPLSFSLQATYKRWDKCLFHNTCDQWKRDHLWASQTNFSQLFWSRLFVSQVLCANTIVLFLIHLGVTRKTTFSKGCMQPPIFSRLACNTQSS